METENSERVVHASDLAPRQRELFWDVLRHNDAPDKQQHRSYSFRMREFELAWLKALAEVIGDSPSEIARVAMSRGLGSIEDEIPEDLRPGAGDIVRMLGEGEG